MNTSSLLVPFSHILDKKLINLSEETLWMVPLFDLLVVLRIKAKGGSILTRGGSVYEGALDSLVIRFSIQAFEVLRYLGFTSTLRVSSVNVVLLTDAASACLHPCCCSFRYKMLNPGLSMPVCGLPIPNRFCVFTSCLVLLPHKSPTNRSKLCHLFFGDNAWQGSPLSGLSLGHPSGPVKPK